MTSTPVSLLECSHCRIPIELSVETVCVNRFPVAAYDLVQLLCVVETCRTFTNIFALSIPTAVVEYFEQVGRSHACDMVPALVVKEFERLFGFEPPRLSDVSDLDVAAFYAWADQA